MRKLLLLALLFLGVYFGIAWYFSGLILFPESSLDITKHRIQTVWGNSYEALIAPLPEPTNFTLQSFDGIPLKGKYFARMDTANCVIIFAHGWTSTWAGMLKYEPVLTDCTCDLVMYDHRGHGESGTAYPTGSVNEAKDLITVTEWVQKTKGFTDKNTGWLGASWGGATVLKAGAADKDVAFIIADAPFQDWHSVIFEHAVKEYGSGMNFVSAGVMQVVNWRTGVDYKEASPLNAASKIVEPVLLIHSTTDEITNSQHSINIAKNLNDQSVFHLLTWGGKHTEDVRIHQDQFQVLINDFLGTVDERFLKK